MGYIHCCSGLRKSRSFSLTPEKNYLISEMDYLEKCPICGHTVIQFTRIDLNHSVSVVRKTNAKARILFEKLKNSIIFEKQTCALRVKAYSSFYLHYNEFGVKKRCYSNLSRLKMGLFEDKNIFNKKILQAIS